MYISTINFKTKKHRFSKGFEKLKSRLYFSLDDDITFEKKAFKEN